MIYWLKIISIFIIATWFFETRSFESIAALIGAMIYIMHEINKSRKYNFNILNRKRKEELQNIAKNEGIKQKNLTKNELINQIILSKTKRKWYNNKWLHVITVIGLALFVSNVILHDSSDKLQQGQDRIERKIDNIINDPINQIDSGFSFYIALTVNEINDGRRKYIFDYGESETINRVSLYFSTKNDLIFRLFNENGESNSCIVPVSSYTFHDGVPFFIYCEVGASYKYSYMRIRINDREIARNDVNFKMNYITRYFFNKKLRSAFSMVRKMKRLESDISTTKFFNPKFKGTINADINENNLSDFWPLEFQIYGWPLSENEVDKIWEEVREIVFPFSDYFKRNLLPFKSAYRIDDQGNIVVIE